MSGDVPRILGRIESGEPRAAEELLPLVYDELPKLAAARMAQEQPGRTRQATALVHEAYGRLVDAKQFQRWDSRDHFFAVALEAMRRILVEQARHKDTRRAGGLDRRVGLDDIEPAVVSRSVELIATLDLDTRLALVDVPTDNRPSVQLAECFDRLRWFGIDVLSLCDSPDVRQ